VDQEIELAEPNFTHLAPEEAAKAVRLLAALIQGCPRSWPQTPAFLPRSPISPDDLAAGSPPVPRGRGKAASSEGAGEGQ